MELLSDASSGGRSNSRPCTRYPSSQAEETLPSGGHRVTATSKEPSSRWSPRERQRTIGDQCKILEDPITSESPQSRKLLLLGRPVRLVVVASLGREQPLDDVGE